MTERGAQTRTYDARHYRSFIYVIMGMLFVMFGGAAVLSFLEGKLAFTIGFSGTLSLIYVFGLNLHYCTPYRVTVSAHGFRADTILGTRWEFPWDRVETIQLQWAHWNRDRVERIAIRIANGPELILVDRINQFEDLVAQTSCSST